MRWTARREAYVIHLEAILVQLRHALGGPPADRGRRPKRRRKKRRNPGYRMNVAEGDFVLLPDGRHGTVYMIEYGCGGCSKIVSIRLFFPPGAKKPWRTRPIRLADEEIDDLELVATKERLETILSD